MVTVDKVDVYQDVGAVSGKDLTHSALGDVIKVVKWGFGNKYNWIV